MSDEDDIPTRANVPKLANHPAYQQKSDDDDDAYPKPGEIKRLDENPAFQQKADKAAPDDKKEAPKESGASNDIDRNLAFLDLTLQKIRREDPLNKISSDKDVRLSDEDAKYHLQEFEVKNNLAVIIVSLDGIQLKGGDLRLKHGEMRQKIEEILAIAKQLFKNNDIYRQWRKSIGKIEKKAREQLYEPDKREYNEFTVPYPQFLDYNGDDKLLPTIRNSISAIRHIYHKHQIVLKHDQWRRQRVRFNITTGKPIIEDYKDENIFIRELQNEISEVYKLSFLEPIMKEALSRIAVKNQFHSMKDKLRQLKEGWDGIARNEMLVKDIYKMEGTALQLAVIEKWLVASMLRVYVPGLKFDIVPYLWSKEGTTKTYSFAVLFGSDNVLEENIYTHTSKEQSEMTYHGIMCVEIADPDDERTTGGKRFKSDVTRRSFRGRHAYARLEEMKTERITYVPIITGNNPKILYNAFGNRRVIPMQLLGAIDVDLLWRNKDQIIGEAVAKAEKAWKDCGDRMRAKGIKVDEMPAWDIKVDEIMLDDLELRSAAALLQKDATVDNPYDDITADSLSWSCVKLLELGNGATYYILSEDIRQHLNINIGYSWSAASQRIAAAMTTDPVLSMSEYQDWVAVEREAMKKYPETAAKKEIEWLDAHPVLSHDIRWEKKQIKKNGKPLKGYRIDLEGEFWKTDLDILEKIREKNGMVLSKK
jgi:Virulence-associated protein E